MDGHGRSGRRWWILVVLCLSTVVLTIDSMALTVAVPSMTSDIGASAQDTQWILDSYILVFAGLLLTSGSLGDRFGRRRVMLIGLVLFGAASLAAAFCSTPAEVIAVRIAMGVGGALIMPSTLSILITVFDEEERPKAMAAWGSVSMLGLVGSPVLGGVLIEHFSWHSIFFLNVPVVALALVAGVTLMPESRAPWQKADPIGAVLSAVGMTALVWWIIEIPKHGAFEGRSALTLTVAVLALAGFVVWENVTASPMVPLVLFKHRNFSGGSLSLALVQIGNGGLLLVLTQYLQFVLGYSPVEAGLAFLPLAVAALVGNGVGVKLSARFGNRGVIFAGMLVMVACFALMTTVGADSGFTTPAVALGLLGLGAGLAMPAAVAALMGTIPADKAGVGSALNDTVQQAGTALGIAILGSLLTSGYTARMPQDAPEAARQSIAGATEPGVLAAARSAFTDSMGTTFMVSAVGVLVAAVVAVLVMRDGEPGVAEMPVEEPELVA
ncbi:MFS transporter [Streptomyces acidiscabies]|uniref:MFS transporter n=1 Tax=Streptomyces acidiscabies TaxID=42234 RepID=A0AAP6B746_9ACTN|nr:MFS transporter [Streptomyces acidiscabies]MBP5939766.1 MFS transporter [Streptomyces sp. LBUM 1476]MBZ3910947.1 MFS transporter [Streptomyces acidiscabies]MDX2959273.1 MFS transporter [Streptomyces acidiscabies]MDX3017583.1 MFS transporter [Streptomyces acidiscabies]MDX3788058.1 MFS transporter [Streptomyces acidiscabies]